MKNIMNSWLNSYKHIIMVEFINLKLIRIQLQICFSEGTDFTHSK